MGSDQQIQAEVDGRRAILKELESWLEIPMVILSVFWFALVLAKLIWRQTRLFEIFVAITWIIFIVEFALRLSIASDRRAFLRSNLITIVALVIPALRMFRVLEMLRLLRANRSLQLLQLVVTAKDSVNALKRSFGRRGLEYLWLLKLAVMLLGQLACLPSSLLRTGKPDFRIMVALFGGRQCY